MASSIVVSVVGDVRDINQKLGTVNKQLSGFGKTASKVSGVAKTLFAGFVVGKAVQGIKSVVTSASDAQQSLGATETVFGKYADTVVARSQQAARAYGLSANDYRESSNLIGSLFSNQGVSADKLAGKTEAMISKAADLSAVFGGPASEAVAALGSAFKGEFDTLEKYGISIKQSQVNTEADIIAKKKYGKELSALGTEQQNLIKQQATTSLINKQSAKTTGAFAKESGTLANQQQVLSAQFENLKATLGTALLPILTKVFGFINNNIIPAFGAALPGALAKAKALFSTVASAAGPPLAALGGIITGQVIPAVQAMVGFFIRYNQVIVPIAAGILAVVAALKVYAAIQAAIIAVTKAWVAVQIALNVVLTANPIGLIVLAIIGLVAAFVVAYKRSEKFRSIVDKAFKGIKIVITAVINFLKPFLSAAFNFIKTIITTNFKVYAAVAKAAWAVIKAVTKSAWSVIKTFIIEPIKAALSAVKSALGSIKSALSSAWNAAKTATKAAWDALKNGISITIDAVMTLVRGIPGRITAALGSLGSLLYNAGKSIIQGLINGIESMIGSVKSKLSSLTSLIPKVKGPPKKDKVLLYDAGRLIIKGLIKGFDDGREGVKDSLESITDLIDKTFAKRFKKNDKLAKKSAKVAIASLEKETKALLKNAKKREAAYKRLENAEKRLADLKKASTDYAKSVANAALGYTNIANLDAAFNAPALAAELRKRLEKVKQFSALIQKLVKSGLNKTAIDQLVQAGVEGGLAVAQAISDGGPDAIKEFNALQAEINKAAEGLGATAAGSMYGAGVKAANGIVKGLKSKAKALEQFAKQLGRNLARAVEDALDINSKTQKAATSGGKVATFSPLASTYSKTQPKAGDNVTINVNVPVTADKAAVGREVAGTLDAYYKKGGRRP